jgi:spermidine synthase
MNNNYINFSQLVPFKLNKNNPLIDLGYIKVVKNNKYLTLFDTKNNGELTTFNIKNYNNVYTYVTNFFDYIKNNKIYRNKVLVLGFGIGGMPLKLSQDVNVEQVDSVDYDHNLFRVFKSIIPNPSIKLNFIHNDVNKYLTIKNRKYDIIFDDIFNSDFGKVMLNYDDVYELLNPNGFLFINIHTNRQLDEIIPKLYKFNILEIIHDNEKLVICQKQRTDFRSKYLKYKIKYLNLKLKL